jgi:hypothetical protein
VLRVALLRMVGGWVGASSLQLWQLSGRCFSQTAVRWVGKQPYTAALPGNADVLGAVRQLQGSSLHSSRAVAGNGGCNGRMLVQPQFRLTGSGK